MAFCKYCGSSVPDKAEFCPECGKKMSASSVSAQSVTTDDVPSRREFFSIMGSPSAKKRIRANWIALAIGLGLRVATIPVNAFLMMPGAMRGQYIGYAFNGLIFSAAGLCILMLLLACAMKHWGFAIASFLLAAYKALAIYTIPLAIGNGAMLIAAVIILINALKLEKEYRAYLDQAFPGSGKKK